MFDIGWSEMAVVALIALIVIGPKELPKAMRAFAKWTRKARSLAREFQSGVDDLVREADIEEARTALDTAKTFDFDKAVEETIDPTGNLRDEAKDLQDTMRTTGQTTNQATGQDAGEDSAEGAEENLEQSAEPAEEAEAIGATVVEHPVKIAPPHSLTPPPEEDLAGLEEAPASDSDGSQRRA